MTEIDVERLISHVENRPVLWNKVIEEYKDRNATKKCWNEVFEQLNPEFINFDDKKKEEFGKEVKKKWESIRDGFTRSRRKKKEATKSGAGASAVKKYIYHDQLLFLLPTTEGRATQDTLTEDNTNQDDNNHDDNNHDPVLDDEVNEELQAGQRARSEKSTNLGSRKRKIDPVGEKILEVLSQEDKPPNRHLSFFEGILPSLEMFSDDEVLSFQTGVLNLIQGIKRQRVQQRTTQCQFSRDPPVPGLHQPPYRRAQSLDAIYYQLQNVTSPGALSPSPGISSPALWSSPPVASNDSPQYSTEDYQ